METAGPNAEQQRYWNETAGPTWVRLNEQLDRMIAPAGRLAMDNAALVRGRAVLGPAEDGGYYLIGSTEAHAELFADIPWGSPRVLDITLERADQVGVDFILLPKLRDIDTAADLWLVAQQLPSLRRFL